MGIVLIPKPTHYEWTPPIWAEIAFVCLMGLAVAVVWAICFRRQVEKLHFSVFSILVLVAMEAVLMWAIQHFDSY
jgi:uncharacterized membrane protein